MQHGNHVHSICDLPNQLCYSTCILIGHIPNHTDLTTYLKNHERYDDLHSQSSQRVLQELAEAFSDWYGKRRNGDTRANPPGYRKHGDEHPRSTVMFKTAGFKLNTQYNRV